MSLKFEQLDVWRMSLDYCDSIYELAGKLPENEHFNLKSQITHSAASISLHLAEGSAGPSDAEQHRFLGMAFRSLIETVVCQRIIARRNYLNEKTALEKLDLQIQELAKRLHALHKLLTNPSKSTSEEPPIYDTELF